MGEEKSGIGGPSHAKQLSWTLFSISEKGGNELLLSALKRSAAVAVLASISPMRPSRSARSGEDRGQRNGSNHGSTCSVMY